MRALTACAACRSRRRKCEVVNGSSTCQYCTERLIPCIRKSTSSTSPQALSPPPSRGAESFLPPRQLSIELVELYFDLIHDQFHSLFHRPSFLDDVRNDRAPLVILYAMMALSARFSTNEVFAGIPPRDRSSSYFEESVMLLDLRDASLTTIQACVLLGAISVTEGNPVNESVYYTVACRIANLIDLAHRPALDAIESEVNIRVWWTLCMVDVWSSTGVGLPRQMVHNDSVPLPNDEGVFRSLRRGSLISSYDGGRQSSLLAQMIILNRILLEINEFISDTVSNRPDTYVIIQRTEELSQKLDQWYAALPVYMHDTRENLLEYTTRGMGRMFVAVYLGYYHFGQLLFYQFLHEDQDSSPGGPGGNYYANKCKAHAASLCAIVYSAHSTPGCEVLYTMVGHILVIASTVQIHTLLFGSDESEIGAARSRMEQNFQILMQLRDYWPTLNICFARLQTFHEVCRKSLGDASFPFRMDMWMLRFLSEFAKPIEDKTENETIIMELCSVDNIGVSPQNWV